MRLQPPSSLCAGPAGSGKTYSIATQLLAGVHVFVIVTEPDGVASLLDACERLKAPIDNLHWRECLPASNGWTALEDMFMKINTMDQRGLADIRDLGKASFRDPAMKFLNALREFECDRTGMRYGDVTTWDDTHYLNFDSLSGISALAWGATVGYKPTANPGEWGIAQNFVYAILQKINSDRQCFFNMTSHIEKELDDMTGVRRVMVSTIGAKLAPKIPPFFSEVILCSKRPGTAPLGAKVVGPPSAQFFWSTLDSAMDLKNRALPVGSSLAPDFRPIVDAYRRRQRLAAPPMAPPDAVSAKPVGGTTTSPSSPLPRAPLTPQRVV